MGHYGVMMALKLTCCLPIKVMFMVKDTEAEKLFRIREAEETKNNLMQVASEHIAPLQDAADLEIATEEEISLLEAWKKYRVLLNRVDTSTAQDIEWPALP